MTYIIFFAVSLLASVVGAICGVGGGVFIKPSLDALGVLPVNTITFLSTCTVISMSCYSVISGIIASKKGNTADDLIDWSLTTWLAIGAAIGGLIGKTIYSFIKGLFLNPEVVGGYQAIALFIAILFTLLYTSNKNKIKSYKISSFPVLILLGFILGTISSFVGIGGGPMNMAVLYFFLSMPTKTAAQNSLYMILISQSSSLVMTFIKGNVPVDIMNFDIKMWIMLIGMILCGICGGKVGKDFNKKLPTKTVDILFKCLCVVIMGLCIFNALSKFNII